MISFLFKAWINKILKWCFHLGTCAHCMLLMLASVYCRIKISLSKHHHPCNVCHKLDKFQTHFLHQRLIGDSSLCWWIDGIQEQVKFKKFLLEISQCKLKPSPRLNPLCIFQMQAVLDIYYLGRRYVYRRRISVLALIWKYFILYMSSRW